MDACVRKFCRTPCSLRMELAFNLVPSGERASRNETFWRRQLGMTVLFRTHRLRRCVAAAKNLGWKIFRKASEAGDKERSASRSMPMRRVIAGRSGFTAIGYSSAGGKAAAGDRK